MNTLELVARHRPEVCDPCEGEYEITEKRVQGRWLCAPPSARPGWKRRKLQQRDQHQRVRAIQRSATALAQLTKDFNSLDRAILKLTEDIFHCQASKATVSDPETGEVSVQISVESAGTLDDLLALNDRWHRELANLGDASSRYCLSLVPSDEST